MDANKILKSLSELEENLKGIDSARQQVEQTVAAYSGARVELTKVSQDIATISNNLQGIFEAIRNNQEVLSTELSTKVKSLLDEIEGKIGGLSTTSNQVIATFDAACKNASSNFANNTATATENLKKTVEDIATNATKNAAENLSHLSTALGEFSTLTKGVKDELSEAVKSIENDHKAANAAAAQDFKTTIGAIITEFDRIKTDMDSVLVKYESISSTILIKIHEELQEVSPSIAAVKALMEQNHKEALTKLDSIDSRLSANTKHIVKLDDIESKLKEQSSTLQDLKPQLVSSIQDCKTGIRSELSETSTSVSKKIAESQSAILNGIEKSQIDNTAEAENIQGKIEELKKVQSFNRIVLILTLLAAGASMLLGLMRYIRF